MEGNKFCKFCGEVIDSSSVVCSKCGRQLIVENEVVNDISNASTIKKEKNFYEQEWFMWVMLVIFAPIGIIFMFKFNERLSKKTKVILAIVFSVLFLISFFSGSSSNSDDNVVDESIPDIEVSDEDSNISSNNFKDSYSFDDKFGFDDLEISIGSNYSFTTINNEYSDYYNKVIVKLPITVKNLSNETHSLNMFYYTVFGSNGTEIGNVGSIYFDDNIDYAGELRSGASYTKYIYMLYDGDGTYSIEFNDWFNKIIVEFDIKK